jgi:hypothetical protein
MTVERRRGPRKMLCALGVRLVLGASAIAGFIVTVGPASAQSASDSATAQALFDRAKALMREGKYADACAALEESQRIESRSGTALNLADCYEHAGRLASAWSTFLEAATLAKATGDTEREIGARDRAALLAPRLSNLVIEAPLAEFTPGLEISRDGQVVGVAQLGLPLPADSGSHTIAATAPGRKRWTKEVMVKNDASTLTLVVPDLETEPREPDVPLDSTTRPLVPGPATGAAHALAPASKEVTSQTRMNGGVIAAGAASGVLIVATVATGVAYLVKRHEYVTANDQLAPNRADLHSQTTSLGIANLALLGGAAVATGVTIFLWTRKPSQPATSAGLELRSVAGPALTGFSLEGRL